MVGTVEAKNSAVASRSSLRLLAIARPNRQRQLGVSTLSMPNGTRSVEFDGVTKACTFRVGKRNEIFESIRAPVKRRRDADSPSAFAHDPIPAALLGDV